MQKTASDNISAAARPGIQDMVKAAMAGSLTRTKVAEEARRQLQEHTAGIVEQTEQTAEKTAAATPRLLKLASACDYISDRIRKEAAEVGPGSGPGALPVSETIDPKQHYENVGEAKTKIPTSTPLQSSTAGGPSTQMQNDMSTPPGGSQSPQPLVGKQASASKVAALLTRLDKTAEDAINPAKISAGSAESTKLEVTDATQSSGTLPGSASLVASIDSAINYTKGQAKSGPKAALKTVLDEPAQTASTDHVLQEAFANTGKAGPKIASAQDTMKVAAARALLSKLAEGAQ